MFVFMFLRCVCVCVIFNNAIPPKPIIFILVKLIYRISEFLQKTAPFANDIGRTQQALDDVSRAIYVFDSLQDRLGSPELQKLGGMSNIL